MTREEAKQLTACAYLIKALAEGETIQEELSVSGRPAKWIDLDFPSFSRPHEKYRIKPKPREFWLIFMPAKPDLIFSSYSSAKTYAECYCPPKEIIHVQEVVS